MSVERFIAINRSKGKKALLGFVRTIKKDLEDGNLDAAQKACKEQQGSVANVVNAALTRYADVENRADQTKEQKMVIIQKEIEESTALELPSMEQNLPVIATISTLGTLFGLLGTVLGMIRSFAALANAGSSRLGSIVDRYFRSSGQYGLRYRYRCHGYYLVQLFHQ